MAETAVIKFGGACFERIVDYTAAARVVTVRARAGERVVVVVSAIRNGTSLLQTTLSSLNRHPAPHVAAQLLTTGDLQSAALLAAAISAEGVPARLLPSHRTGLRGAGSPLRARLVDYEADYLRAMVRDHRVVVLPGGQATDEQGMVVMLGRNSSDLTAVCVAAALGSRTCHIVSDVLGVHTADPVMVSDPPLIEAVDYQTVLEAGHSGARVLHPQAVRMAREHRIEIHCTGRPPAMTQGTVVGPFPTSSESIVVAAAASEVWRVKGMRSLERTETELRRESIDSVPIVGPGDPFLVVPDDFSAATTERICGSRGVRTDLRMLSLIRPGREPERLLVPAADLAEHARRCHTQLRHTAAGPAS